MFHKTILPVYVLVLMMSACSQNTHVVPVAPTDEYMFVVNLVPDSVKMREYFSYHEHIWPEVEQGFKKAGYQKIALYRYANTLVMQITVPKGADLDSMGKIAEASNPRCVEWNKLMNNYQQGVEGTKPGQTWVRVEKFFEYNQ